MYEATICFHTEPDAALGPFWILPLLESKPAHVQIIEAEYKEVTETEKTEVVELGGLHVIGTERHESRRIDNQLRGRGGRCSLAPDS